MYIQRREKSCSPAFLLGNFLRDLAADYPAVFWQQKHNFYAEGSLPDNAYFSL
jgi:hypothetical protein